MGWEAPAAHGDSVQGLGFRVRLQDSKLPSRQGPVDFEDGILRFGTLGGESKAGRWGP